MSVLTLRWRELSPITTQSLPAVTGLAMAAIIGPPGPAQDLTAINAQIADLTARIAVLEAGGGGTGTSTATNFFMLTAIAA